MQQPHHELLGQGGQLPEHRQAGGGRVVQLVQRVGRQRLQVVVQVLALQGPGSLGGHPGRQVWGCLKL